MNNKLPCAWGGDKVMLAFAKVTVGERTPLMKKAIQQGMDFFFGIDPATAHLGSLPLGKWRPLSAAELRGLLPARRSTLSLK